MPLPTGWPPRVSSTRRSIRFYATGTATTDFDDNAFLFVDAAGANTYTALPVIAPGSSTVTALGAAPYGTGSAGSEPKPMIWSTGIVVRNLGGTNPLEFSFDGLNVAGTVLINETRTFYDRFEAGIAIRTTSGTSLFTVEAW